MTWTPTETFLRGKIVRPFTPFEKHPTLINENLRNLFPGDEIYIFETKNNRWARAYVLLKPLPNDFTITSVNLDELPGKNIRIVVFPLKYSIVVEKIPFPIVDINVNNVDNPEHIPTIQESEIAHRLALDGEVEYKKSGFLKTVVPQLPVNLFDKNDDFIFELKNCLDLLTSQLFNLYSIGEFRLFNKLSAIYYNLDQLRVRLQKDVLTRYEAQVAKETAIYLVGKIAKKLSSRTARLNAESYDLDNKNTDISGYKSVLARDPTSGDLLTSESSPSEVALSQVLCGLAPNYPINSHNRKDEFSLKPKQNRRLTFENPSHILVDFKSVSGSSVYQPPGFAGTIAYLYIRNQKKRLTEAFAVHTDSVEDLVQVEKISAALFKNIPSSETDGNRVYLVAVLTEEVDIPSNSTSTKIIRVKKGIAAGVADITRIFSRNQGSLESGEAHRFSIRLFGSFLDKSEKHQNAPFNHGWGELVDRIISGSDVGVAVNPRAETLVVSVKEFKHKFIENYTPINTTTPISRIKPIFYDPMAENYERIYLTFKKSELLNASASGKENLLTFEVSTPNNDAITFAKASNQQEQRSWQFVSVGNGEVVGEIVKVNGVAMASSKKVPKDDYISIKLLVNGNYAGEGKVLYKSGTKLVEFDKKSNHVCNIFSKEHTLLAKLEVETEYIGKSFNSDIAIDNIFQYEKLFQSGNSGIDELITSLAQLCKLELSQLLRYFNELLNCLFNITSMSLRQNKNIAIDLLQENSFKAFIYLFDTLFGKQEQYLYLLDEFLQKNPKLPQIGSFLFNRIGRVFLKVETSWSSISRSLCRICPLLFKVANKTIDQKSDPENYEQCLTSLFQSLTFFLSVQNTSIINDQVLVLELVDYILTFDILVDKAKMLDLVTIFIDSIGTRGLGANEENLGAKKAFSPPKDHKIIVSKLLLIHRLFNTVIIDEPTMRDSFISQSIGWSMEVFSGPLDIDATRLASSILNSSCKIIAEGVKSGDKGLMNISYSLSKLLPAISTTIIKYHKYTRSNAYFKPKKIFTQLFPSDYPFKENSMDSVINDEVCVEVLIELSSLFSYVAKIGKSISGDEGYNKILSTKVPKDFFDDSKYLAANFKNEDIFAIITGINIIRKGKFFPEDKWLSVYSIFTEGCLNSLELLRKLLLQHYIPSIENSEQFDRAIWGNYLLTLLKLAALAPVSIEHLADVPKKACYYITGSIRSRIALLVNEAWDALAWDAPQESLSRFNMKKFGGFQVEFISSGYSIVEDLMLFSLQKNTECQAVGVKILWSIIVSEYMLSESIIDVERSCLMSLNNIYTRNGYKPKPIQQEEFIRRLKLTIRVDREDEAYGMIVNFIETLSGFMLVLNDLNDVPVGPEFDDDRTFHRLNINAYLKNADKPELLHYFINGMYLENLGKGDHIQAALSLELLASTYTWDHNDVLPPSLNPKFPLQSSFERKETLYKLIAKSYIKGNRLEKATDLYNELLDVYNEHTYDLKSFADVHTKLAKLYLDLESSDKISSSFFKVSYIGAGFPTNIRGKQLIYEGLPFEHITSIHERLIRLYPGSRIVSDDAEAERLIKKVPTGRYLHVTTVEPVEEISDKLFNTSFGVRQYARNKDLRSFTTLRKIPGANSVFDLWTEETTYETYVSFPTLMNRSEIKSTKVIKLSPLENAIRAICSKTNDLIQLESLINISFKEKTDFSALFNDLSRQVAGTVVSPVNGGVGQYRTFFTEYQGEEQYEEKLKLLRNSFNDLTIILNRCLQLHGKIVPLSMKASHEALVDLFKKNFKDDIETLKIDVDQEQTSSTTPSHFQPMVAGNSSRRSITAASGSYTGPRLMRTVSRSSKSSSTSSNSGLSSGKISSTYSTNSGTSNSRKRTAVNWRSMLNV